jgi:hypothetical protein
MKNCIVYWMAKLLPNNCPTERFGFSICKLNPWYDEVIEQKLKNLGY